LFQYLPESSFQISLGWDFLIASAETETFNELGLSLSRLFGIFRVYLINLKYVKSVAILKEIPK